MQEYQTDHMFRVVRLCLLGIALFGVEVYTAAIALTLLQLAAVVLGVWP